MLWRFRAAEHCANDCRFADFVRKAVLAKLAGYDGVEIMGSEGYLLSPHFVSPRTTTEATSTAARRWKSRADLFIIFRLSLLDLVQDGLLFADSIALAALVEQDGATKLITGIGWHEARIPTISPAVPLPFARQLEGGGRGGATARRHEPHQPPRRGRSVLSAGDDDVGAAAAAD